MSKDDPLETNISEVLGTDLSGVCSEAIVGAILSSNPIVELLIRIECEYRRDVQGDRRDDNI